MLPSSLASIGTASVGAAGNIIPNRIGGTGVIDTTNTDWLAIHLGGTFVATIIAEGSFDGTNWSSIPMIDSSGTVTNTGVTGTGIFVIQTLVPMARLRCSAYTSGTVSLFGGTTNIKAAPVNH